MFVPQETEVIKDILGWQEYQEFLENLERKVFNVIALRMYFLILVDL